MKFQLLTIVAFAALASAQLPPGLPEYLHGLRNRLPHLPNGLPRIPGLPTAIPNGLPTFPHIPGLPTGIPNIFGLPTAPPKVPGPTKEDLADQELSLAQFPFPKFSFPPLPFTIPHNLNNGQPGQVVVKPGEPGHREITINGKPVDPDNVGIKAEPGKPGTITIDGKPVNVGRTIVTKPGEPGHHEITINGKPVDAANVVVRGEPGKPGKITINGQQVPPGHYIIRRGKDGRQEIIRVGPSEGN